MSIPRLGCRVLLCVTAACAVPASARASVIVFAEFRSIYGYGHSFSDCSSSGCTLENFENYTDEAPAPGEPWSATDGVTVTAGTASATSAATQTSTAGPFTFEGRGAAIATATAAAADQFAIGYGQSFYEVVFQLTDTNYAYTYNAAVAAGGTGSGGTTGYAKAALFDSSGKSFAPSSETYASGSGPRFVATASHGILTPGVDYYFQALAYGQATAGTSYGSDPFAAAAGGFNVALQLTPESLTAAGVAHGTRLGGSRFRCRTHAAAKTSDVLVKRLADLPIADEVLERRVCAALPGFFRDDAQVVPIPPSRLKASVAETHTSRERAASGSRSSPRLFATALERVALACFFDRV
jgi:hypothetical protein